MLTSCAQQSHTEISDNIYELEEDEDNVFVRPSYDDTLEYIIYNRIQNDTSRWKQCYAEYNHMFGGMNMQNQCSMTTIYQISGKVYQHNLFNI